jgi:hydrogenase nickel incorporation protein HypB
MRAHCGCSEHSDQQAYRDAHAPAHERGNGRAHEDGRAHGHQHAGREPLHEATGRRGVTLEHAIVAANGRLAAQTRAFLRARRVTAINLMSSPGAGKTMLLERTLRELSEVAAAVIEGDQAPDRDAARIRAAGAAVIQISTGTGCHLDAHTVARALGTLALSPGSLLAIENVGNLVCPALFDLGERLRVVVLSVTEGDDKPEKYPHMFRACDVLIINKIDLMPYVPFDLERCINLARRAQPRVRVLALSALCGNGLRAWYDLLQGALRETASDASSGQHLE